MPTFWGFSLDKSTSYLSFCFSPNAFRNVQFTGNAVTRQVARPVSFLGDGTPGCSFSGRFPSQQESRVTFVFPSISPSRGLFRSLVGTGYPDLQEGILRLSCSLELTLEDVFLVSSLPDLACVLPQPCPAPQPISAFSKLHPVHTTSQP